MLHTQEVSGSSPFTPTIKTRMNTRFVRVLFLPKSKPDYHLTTFPKNKRRTGIKPVRRILIHTHP
jgi:hypothetical protein